MILPFLKLGLIICTNYCIIFWNTAVFHGALWTNLIHLLAIMCLLPPSKSMEPSIVATLQWQYRRIQSYSESLLRDPVLLSFSVKVSFSVKSWSVFILW